MGSLKKILTKLFGTCFLMICMLSTISMMGQEEKTVSKAKRDDYKNIIKFNLSSQILYRNTFLLGYERVVKQNQSINISGGYIEFPLSLKFPESVQAKGNKERSGYTIQADWRFYLGKENRYPAPHGAYLAPFLAIHHFANERAVTYTDSSGNPNDLNLDYKVDFLTIGGQFGYQFVIKRRFVVDAVMFGPGITNYKFKANVEGNITPAEEGSLEGEVIKALREKLPLLDELASTGQTSGSGTQSFWSVGFRYSVSIGFRF